VHLFAPALGMPFDQQHATTVVEHDSATRSVENLFHQTPH
jgi:hypothetical protein